MKKEDGKMSLDLSINSTGICLWDGEEYIYRIITPHITRTQRRAVNERLEYIDYVKKDNDDWNIFQIKGKIRELIEEYNICMVTMEAPAFQAHGRATATLAGLNYSIRQMLMEMGIEYKLVQPTTLKKWFTGNGKADKGMMVKMWLECDPDMKSVKAVKLDDLADAYALWQFRA